MKTKDRLKEEIGLYKLLMTIASAMFSSVINWLFSNNATASVAIKIILLLIVVVFMVSIIFFLFEINTKIKELDYE